MTERRDPDLPFKALADPSRRKLLDLLHAHDGPWKVAEPYASRST